MIDTVSEIMLYSMTLGIASFNAWFAGKMFEKAHRNRRDIDAIAMRVREVEAITETRLTALDFTVKTLLNDRGFLEDTGFNMDTIKPKK